MNPRTTQYLARLNIAQQDVATMLVEEKLRYLSQLYLAHITSFPFQNFELRDIALEHPLERHQLTFFSNWHGGINGGFCFQSAHLLYSVLTGLGFTVTRGLARVLGGMEVNSEELLALPATHIFLMVQLGEQQFLLDPGIGSRAPRTPVLMDVTHTEANDRLRLIDSVYVLEKKVGEKWVQLFQTDLQAVSDKEIHLALRRLERYPKQLGIRDSKLVIGVVTPTGNKYIYWESPSTEFTFCEESNGRVSKTTTSDFSEVCRLLRVEFNITHINENDLLWFASKKTMPKPQRRWSLAIDFRHTDDDRYHTSRELVKMRGNI